MQVRTSLPEYGNPFYNTTDVGGYSTCIYGVPTCDGRNVLSNCVGYACGRFNEIIGYMKYPAFNCNAENFIKRARQYYPELKITDYPTQGGIMVFHKIGEDYGHVFIVEKVIDENTIYTSESVYGDTAFFNATRYRGSNWSMGDSYEFLGCINNPAVNNEPVEIKYEKGNTVIVNGRIYSKATPDGVAGVTLTNYKAVITLIYDGEDRVHPYNIEHGLGWVGNDEVTLYEKPKPEPTKEIVKGTRVRTTGTGNESSYGDGGGAMTGLEGIVTNIIEGRPYPYLVSDNDGPLGWYKKENLEII